MAKRKAVRLGDLQLRIMRVLWSEGGATVAEVQQQLGGEGLAYTTVATMLRKMEGRGLVRHREEGRRFVYQAAVSDRVVTHGMANDLVERLFQGSLSAAVSHLLDSRQVSVEELDEIEQLVRARRKQR
jgi:predicted transcriptional regulator